MKSRVQAIVLAVVLVAPVVAMAQSNQPLSRAQVRSEMVQLEQGGYNPTGRNIAYPADIQAAEAKVASQHGRSGYGVASGTSDAESHQ